VPRFTRSRVRYSDMPSAFFPAVEPDAAVHPILEELRPAVDAQAELLGDVDPKVHTELRVDIAADGVVQRRRFYWSAQHADPRSPLGFGARTLYCGATDAPRGYVFPSEPALVWLDDPDGPLRFDGDLASVEILRYIPLRRLTYRLHDGVGLPASVIAKAKRTGGLNRAATALLAVNEATGGRRARGGPTVPRLLRLEPLRHVLYLEELPGEPLDVALQRLDLTEAMEQLGTLHRELHELDVRGLPQRRTTADWLQDARQAATQIGLFAPSVAREAQAVHAELERTVPEEGRLMFGQGDFLPGQVLCDPSGWSVIDFDDSRYADPLFEVAALYAALPGELRLPPDLAERAQRTYLEAYARRSGEPIDPDRWRWFLVLVQLSVLAKRLVKGRAPAGEAASILERLVGPQERVVG
jgi:aminoglycoside phosphotransferase